MASNTAEKFWIVWCKDGGTPTVKHVSLRSAQQEAQRLARHCEGREFVVLESLEGFEVVRMQKIEYKDFDPGF